MFRPTVAAFVLAAMLFSTAHARQGLEWEDAGEGKVRLTANRSPVLVYSYGTVSGEGVHSRYDRANYLHPVYGLDGEVLTEDFPEDHAHHRGIFWAWPHIRVGGGRSTRPGSRAPALPTCRGGGCAGAATRTGQCWRRGTGGMLAKGRS